MGVKKKINWWKAKFDNNEVINVTKAIKNKNISQGNLTRKFEVKLAKKLKVKYAVLTINGTTSLLMAMMVCNIKSGDEVIIQNRTWISPANAAFLLNAKVKLVEVNSDRPTINLNDLKAKLTKKTKLIVVTHLNGYATDLQKIKSILKKKKSNAYIIEDAAQALGSKYKNKYLGTQSIINCFSLSMTKLISTGQGGFLTTNNKKIYNKLKLLRVHSLKNYPHDNKFLNFGFNFKYTDIQASFGLSQLKKFNLNIKKVFKIYSLYLSKLKENDNIKIIKSQIKEGELPIYVEVLIKKNRGKFIKYMNKNNIFCRTFYNSLNEAPYLNIKGKFKNSDNFSRNGVYLPCGPDQKISDINQVIKVINLFKF